MAQIMITLDTSIDAPEFIAELLRMSTGNTAPASECKTEAKAPATKKEPTAKPIEKVTPKETTAAPADLAPAAEPAPSKTDVRAMALALSKSGKQDAIKAIFAKFGGEKLSDMKETDYPALMKDLVSANG